MPVFGQSEEDLYELIFGIKPDTSSQRMIVKGVVNNFYRDEIAIDYVPFSGVVSFDKDMFFELIRDDIVADAQLKLEEKWVSLNRVSQSELEKNTFKVQFDHRKLTVLISFPPEWRTKTILSVNKQSPFYGLKRG